MRKVRHALVAMGGNASRNGVNPPDLVRAAARELAGPGIDLVALSPLYATPCFPPGAGPDYANAAALIATTLDPAALLSRLHRIEASYGRERVKRWGQRTLDLDLLAYGDLVLPDAATQDHWRNLPPQDQSRLAPDQLILPHPRLQDRAFVLVPLADVAPGWRHPRLGQTVLEMLNRLEMAEIAAVTPL